jgi:type IX secretion system PorP/SprF family membrane protein
MKKGVIILVLCWASSFALFAQDDTQFTLFPWAASYYNAGAIGEQHNTLCFTGIFSQAKMNFRDVYKDDNGNSIEDQTGLQDIYFSLESYLKQLHGSIGVTFLKDKDGYNDNIGFKLGYAFKMNIPTGRLSIGFQVGMWNRQLDGDKLRTIHDGDPVVENLKNTESFLDLDFNFGILYKAERWYVGVGATNLAATNKLRLSGDPHIWNPVRQLYLHGGYTYVFPNNPSWEIEPQLIVKTDLKQVSFDILALARYNKVFWGGLSYRYTDDISLLFGARPFYNSPNNYLKGLDVGLSYGFPISKLGTNKNSFGTVEIMVRYCFDIYKEPVFSGYGSSRSIYKNQY